MPEYDRVVVRPRVFYDNGRGATVFATSGVSAEDRAGRDARGPASRPTARRSSRRSTRVARTAASSGDGSRRAAAWWRSGARWRRSGQDRHVRRCPGQGRRLVWFGEASVAGVSGRHAWVVGGAISQDRYRNEQDPRRRLHVHRSGRIRAGRRANQRHRHRVGLRAARRAQQYGVLVNPRVSLLGRPSQAWTLRVSTGLGTFAPTPFTEETEEVGFSRLRFRDDLDVERAWAIVGGCHARHRLVRAHGHRVLLPRQRSRDARRPQRRSVCADQRVRAAMGVGRRSDRAYASRASAWSGRTHGRGRPSSTSNTAAVARRR